MIAFFVFFVEMLILFELSRRVRRICAPHLVILYCISAQLVFYNAGALGYANVAGPESLLSYQTHAIFGIIVYFLIIVISYVSTIGFRLESSNNGQQLIGILQRNERVLYYSFVSIVLYTLVHFALIDFDSLWYHRDYSTTGLRFDGGVFSIFGRLRPLIAMASILLMHLSFFTNKPLRFIVLLLISIWHFIIPFTGASRYAVVLIFVSGAAATTFAPRGRLLICLAHVVCGFLVLQAMIAGRSGTEFGLAAIPTLVMEMFSFDAYSMAFGLFNLFQGITVTVDGLIMAPKYDSMYAFLSISPLPSSIDGFDAVLARNEYRLSIFVPMSSIAESYLFGWSIFSFVVAVFFLSLRSTLSVARNGYQLWSLLSSTFLAAMFIMANAYPLRNTFRQFLLILIINSILSLLARRRAMSKQSSRDQALLH